MYSRSEGPKVASTSVSVGGLLTQGATAWRYASKMSGSVSAIVPSRSSSLLLELGPERLLLRPGDSVVFDSQVPHRTLNVGIIPMRAVWVNFQPAAKREEPTSEPVPSKGRKR
jgi:hypothetical protein